MEEKTFRLATILLSLATLLLTAIITVGGYIKFQTVDSSLAKLDATIKESEGRIKVVEAQKGRSINPWCQTSLNPWRQELWISANRLIQFGPKESRSQPRKSRSFNGGSI